MSKAPPEVASDRETGGHARGMRIAGTIMRMASSVTIDEPKLRRLMAKGTSKVVERKCIVVQTIATMLSPIDTGRLRASITYVLEPSDDLKRLRGFVGTNVEYAPEQEFGTFKMAAHPFLRPALTHARAA